MKLGANYMHDDGSLPELVRERVKLVPREDMIAISRGE